MNSIIYSCKQGDVVEGFVGRSSVPLHGLSVFIQNPWDRLGVSSNRVDYFTSEEDDFLVKHIEISHFVEMLYEGVYEAWYALFLDGEDVIKELFDIVILKKEKENLLNFRLVENIIEKSDEYFQNIDFEAINDLGENEEVVNYVISSYHRDLYFSIKRLYQAMNIISSDTIKLNDNQTRMLDGINLGDIGIETLIDFRKEYREKVSNEADRSNLVEQPSLQECNELVLKIRNLEIKEKDYE